MIPTVLEQVFLNSRGYSGRRGNLYYLFRFHDSLTSSMINDLLRRSLSGPILVRSFYSRMDRNSQYAHPQIRKCIMTPVDFPPVRLKSPMDYSLPRDGLCTRMSGLR